MLVSDLELDAWLAVKGGKRDKEGGGGDGPATDA